MEDEYMFPEKDVMEEDIVVRLLGEAGGVGGVGAPNLVIHIFKF
jgi:hypothetical protein